ncbi:hypothetical protein CARUB_v10019357mg [Capsella rubella]|uniref:Uncharacterized protein n=1 Tax=Capsella rubella TaxID=81985 RepID=R0HPW1_9BRAS|nr:hypothetical protein CARUB_v10019357mg [Capsella rubella]
MFVLQFRLSIYTQLDYILRRIKGRGIKLNCVVNVLSDVRTDVADGGRSWPCFPSDSFTRFDLLLGL